MIDLDEIQETPKPNHIPLIVLGIAAGLLVIVGFLGYRDWVQAEAEKKVAKAKGEMVGEINALKEQVNDLVTNGSNNNTRVDPQIAKDRAELLALIEKVDRIEKANEESRSQSDTDNPGEEVLKDADFLPPIPAGITNPDLLKEKRTNLSANQRSRYLQPQDDIEVPEALRNSVANPPGGVAPLPQPAGLQNLIKEEQEKFANMPAIGEVINFNSDWGIVTINAGRLNNLRKDAQFSIRRGSSLLGKIRIEEVNDEYSIGRLITNNKLEGIPFPEAGDLVVSLF